MSQKKSTPKNNYAALRIIVTLYMFIGALVFFGSVLFGRFTMISYSRFGSNLGTGIGIILSGTVTAIGLIAFAQLIQVGLELVDNTRRQIQLLEHIARASRRDQ
jgi:hypothetical protein